MGRKQKVGLGPAVVHNPSLGSSGSWEHPVAALLCSYLGWRWHKSEQTYWCGTYLNSRERKSFSAAFSYHIISIIVLDSVQTKPACLSQCKSGLLDECQSVSEFLTSSGVLVGQGMLFCSKTMTTG